MLEDLQTVFAFLGYLISVAQHLYEDCACFYLALYFLGLACLVRLVYRLAGTSAQN